MTLMRCASRSADIAPPRSNLLDRRYRPFFGNNATATNCDGSRWNKTTAPVSLLAGSLRRSGRVKFAHHQVVIAISAANADSAFIFLSREGVTRGIKRDRRHGFVRLSPCFSRALAAVSAESRQEAK